MKNILKEPTKTRKRKTTKPCNLVSDVGFQDSREKKMTKGVYPKAQKEGKKEKSNFFSERLQRFLQDNKITVSELAKSCGLPTITIYRWLNNSNLPEKSKLEQLAQSEYMKQEGLRAEELFRLAQGISKDCNFSSAEEALESVSLLPPMEQQELIYQLMGELPSAVLHTLLTRGMSIIVDREMWATKNCGEKDM